jgi:hypothetical protein
MGEAAYLDVLMDRRNVTTDLDLALSSPGRMSRKGPMVKRHAGDKSIRGAEQTASGSCGVRPWLRMLE